MITRKILKQKVSITGTNFLGKESTIVFSPVNVKGWYLKAIDKKNNQMYRVPIDYKIASCKTGRISITKYNSEITCWEHIGPLRYAGIDSIEIYLEKGSWPPYFTTKELYDQLLPYLIETNEKIHFAKTLYNTEKYHNKNKKVFTKINKSHSFSLTVRAGWPGLKEKQETFIFDDNFQKILLEKIFPARPQGYPHYRYYFAKVIKKLGWKNFYKVSWLKETNNIEKTSDEWFYHRVLDNLGALSLGHHKFLLSIHGITHFAGHKIDMGAMEKIY